MIYFSLIVVLASAIVFWGNPNPIFDWLSFVPIFIALAFYFRHARWVFLFCAAIIWSDWQMLRIFDHRLAKEFDGEVVFVSGRISDRVEHRQGSIRFNLKPDFIVGYPHSLPKNIRLSWYRSNKLPKAGEHWYFRVKLKQPSGFSNPGIFDYERWLFGKEIGATGYVKSSKANKQLSSAAWWDIARIRESVADSIHQNCLDCQYGGLFAALTIGFRGDIPTDQRQLLQDTATAHLLAISGLHIGLVASLFYALGRWLWSFYFYRCRINRLELSASFGMFSATCYAALAGFSLPTVRALIMLAVIFAALLMRRGINLLNSLATAVVIILLIDPSAVGSASFWLSVSALLIIAVGQFLWIEKAGWFKQLLRLQFLFSLLFVPLGMLLFSQVNFLGFLANLVAIPLVSLIILPMVLLSALLAVFELWGASYLFTLSDFLMATLIGYLDAILIHGPNLYQAGGIPNLLLVLAAIGLLVFVLPVNSSLRKPAILLIALPFLWRPEKLEQGGFRLSVLDVGMGTAIVVETRNHSLIYDFGPGNDAGFSAGEWVVKPYLQYRQIAQTDLMVISHVDQDHSGGFFSFVKDANLSRLLSGTPQALRKRFNLSQAITDCHTYPSWQWDGVRFEFLQSKEQPDDLVSNDQSCILSIDGAQTALLPGDIEGEQEQRLLVDVTSRLPATILVAPHHGSLTSSTEAFVKQVAPEFVVFTLSKGNRWAFPRPEVLSRYQSQGSQIYRSDIHGAVIFTVTANGIEVETGRQGHKRLWSPDRD